MSDNVIEVRNLTQRYGDFTALDQVGFDVKRHEIVGLLGPNGAGKTTLINILTGLRKPTEGSVKVLGYDMKKSPELIQSKLGLIPQRNVTLDMNLNVFDNLYFFSMLNSKYDKKKIHEILDVFQLSEVAYSLVNQISGGMKRKLILARLALSEPEIIFLDEPTVGIDIYGKKIFANFLREFRKEMNATVLITTHDMAEAEYVCDKIIILNRGKLLDNVSISKIKSTYYKKLSVSFKELSDQQLLLTLPWIAQQSIVQHDQLTYSFFLNKRTDTLGDILTNIEQLGTVTSIYIDDISLEDYFTTVIYGQN